MVQENSGGTTTVPYTANVVPSGIILIEKISSVLTNIHSKMKSDCTVNGPMAFNLI